MAPPRAVSKSLRKTATQLAKIPDVAVANGVEEVIADAARIGGGFGPSRRPLIAEAKVRKRKTGVNAVVFGRPAGAWSIMTNGRGPVAPVNKKALRAGARYFMSAGAAGPVRRKSWDRVEEAADVIFPKALDEAVDAVI